MKRKMSLQDGIQYVNEEMADSFKCMVCHELSDPFRECPICNTGICLGCAENYLAKRENPNSKTFECPICKTQIEKFRANNSVSRRILNLKIICNKCKTQLDFSGYEQHKKKCNNKLNKKPKKRKRHASNEKVDLEETLFDENSNVETPNEIENEIEDIFGKEEKDIIEEYAEELEKNEKKEKDIDELPDHEIIERIEKRSSNDSTASTPMVSMKPPKPSDNENHFSYHILKSCQDQSDVKRYTLQKKLGISIRRYK